jgi:ureidoacrylate peracid hydrolase
MGLPRLCPNFQSSMSFHRTQRRKMKVKLKARPEALDIDLRSTAVVVVDMQNAFVAKGGLFDLAGMDISRAGQVIGVAREVVERARMAGLRIVYLQMGYKVDLSNSGGPDSPNWHKELALVLMKNGLLGRTPLTEGTWDFAIVDQLKPRPEDLVIVKSRYSGFYNTELDSILRSESIRSLLFAGVATNVCVESTLRDAFFLDYWPVLIADATMQAGPAYLQQATIENVENHFGWSVLSRDLLKSLE